MVCISSSRDLVCTLRSGELQRSRLHVSWSNVMAWAWAVLGAFAKGPITTRGEGGSLPHVRHVFGWGADMVEVGLQDLQDLQDLEDGSVVGCPSAGWTMVPTAKLPRRSRTSAVPFSAKPRLESVPSSSHEKVMQRDIDTLAARWSLSPCSRPAESKSSEVISLEVGILLHCSE